MEILTKQDAERKQNQNQNRRFRRLPLHDLPIVKATVFFAV